ncbi:hypothetical protein RI367_008255 [Sorochytrium milnesiophthora]
MADVDIDSFLLLDNSDLVDSSARLDSLDAPMDLDLCMQLPPLPQVATVATTTPAADVQSSEDTSSPATAMSPSSLFSYYLGAELSAVVRGAAVAASASAAAAAASANHINPHHAKDISVNNHQNFISSTASKAATTPLPPPAIPPARPTAALAAASAVPRSVVPPPLVPAHLVARQPTIAPVDVTTKKRSLFNGASQRDPFASVFSPPDIKSLLKPTTAAAQSVSKLAQLVGHSGEPSAESEGCATADASPAAAALARSSDYHHARRLSRDSSDSPAQLSLAAHLSSSLGSARKKCDVDLSRDGSFDDMDGMEMMEEDSDCEFEPSSSSSLFPAKHANTDPFMLDDNALTLSAKERRQLRNKISARNFRQRKKQYMEMLEGQVRALKNELNTEKRERAKKEDEVAHYKALVEDLTKQLKEWRALGTSTPATVSPSALDAKGTLSAGSAPSPSMAHIKQELTSMLSTETTAQSPSILRTSNRSMLSSHHDLHDGSASGFYSPLRSNRDVSIRVHMALLPDTPVMPFQALPCRLSATADRRWVSDMIGYLVSTPVLV